MADVTLSDSAERDRLDLVNLSVGFLVLTAGIFLGAIAVQYLLLG
ncbi:MAG: hypothetical protein ABSB33_03920 [Tepidisphaeraceae bacterium]|jgi:hypothetical protein